MAKQVAAKAEVIEIPEIDIRVIQIEVVGVSKLVCHAWSDKAKKMMLDKQMGKASAGRKKKDPKQDYEDSLYPHPDGGYGFPSIAFKSCAVRGAKACGMVMTDARSAFHIPGELVKLKGKPTMAEDMVRIGNGVADIRYRGKFEKWSAVLTVRYNARVITAEQLINMFNLGGFGTGIGEHRPEKNGANGMFEVKLA